MGGGFQIHFLHKYFTHSEDSTEFICRKNLIWDVELFFVFSYNTIFIPLCFHRFRVHEIKNYLGASRDVELWLLAASR